MARDLCLRFLPCTPGVLRQEGAWGAGSGETGRPLAFTTITFALIIYTWAQDNILIRRGKKEGLIALKHLKSTIQDKKANQYTTWLQLPPDREEKYLFLWECLVLL